MSQFCRFSIILLCFFAVIPQMLAQRSKTESLLAPNTSEQWLQSLDSVIQQRPVFDAMKKRRLEELLKNREKQRTPHEILSFNTMLYNECFVFDSDMAMRCIEENLEIARHLGDYSLFVEWTIRQSFILSATGLLKTSLDVIEPLNISDMPNSIKIEYYGQMTYLYSHFGQYTGEGALQEHYIEQERLYNDSIHQIITPDDPQFLWHDVWYRINTGDFEQTREQLQTKVSQSSMTTRDDAMAAYALACIYRAMGNQEEFVRYLAMSGVADIRASNKDIASLQELAELLIDLGEISRAYNYINICMQASLEYHNRVRSVSIGRVRDKILQGFMTRDEEQRQNLTDANRVMTVLIVLLVIAIVWIAAIFFKLNRSSVASQ